MLTKLSSPVIKVLLLQLSKGHSEAIKCVILVGSQKQSCVSVVKKRKLNLNAQIFLCEFVVLVVVAEGWILFCEVLTSNYHRNMISMCAIV